MPLVDEGLPRPLRTIHVMGICGTAMGALAEMLVDAGYRVTGSDAGAWPPMSEILASIGIEVMAGWRREHLDHHPDLVVVGNVVRAEYEEARALLESQLPYCSFPHLLGELFLRQARSLVVAGTHGKTTTTAVLAWLARAAGLEPGYLVGGQVVGWERTARAGAGTHFVIEGDEYDTAFFDKSPKFLHYHASTAVLTSVEFDHADIYRDLDHVKSSFRALVRSLPAGDGLLVARWDDPAVREVAAEAPCETWRYGPGQDWDGRVEEVDTERGTMRFTLLREGLAAGSFTSVLVGRHNLYDQVAAIAALAREGVEPAELVDGLRSFRGIRRRQELFAQPGGIALVDDFAHHPTAVRATIAALRMRFGGRRLWVLFEPRSNSSRRRVFQQAYAEAFDGADLVVIAPPHDQSRIDPGRRLDPQELAAAIRARGVEAIHLPEIEQIRDAVAANAMEADVVALFSNGDFGGLHGELRQALELRFGGDQPS